MKPWIAILFLVISFASHAATVVMHCVPAAPDRILKTVEVILDGDKLDAYVDGPGAVRTRYDISLATDGLGNNIGYAGQYLHLKTDDWNKVIGGAQFDAQFPIPPLESLFHPNVTTRLNCEWKS